MKLASLNHKTNKKRRLLLQHEATLGESPPQDLADGSCIKEKSFWGYLMQRPHF